MASFEHTTVLLDEAVAALAPERGGYFVDATVGGGGHAERLLECADVQLLGIDRDPAALRAAGERLARYGQRVRLAQATFGEARSVLRDTAFGHGGDGGRSVDGLLADLGVSSPQIDVPERGFSFQTDGPLDMRMSEHGETAAALIDRLSEDDLARVLARYGEVRGARRVARAIRTARREGRLSTTGELATLCEELLGRPGVRRKHPATTVFQALRIAVNDEIGELERLLAAIPSLLAPGGVACIISFHSLEDRLVKRRFRELVDGPKAPRGLPVRSTTGNTGFEHVVRRASAGDAERSENPRARSATLRAIRRAHTAEGP